MKIKELIAELQTYDPEMLMVCNDGEYAHDVFGGDGGIFRTRLISGKGIDENGDKCYVWYRCNYCKRMNVDKPKCPYCPKNEQLVMYYEW